MDSALTLASRQLARDAKRSGKLFAHKLDRMRLSPLALLRGAAPLYYELLAQDRWLRKGPPGEGWIAGDLHLENFGAYRPHTHAADDDPHHAKRHGAGEIATFNLNDFDDAIVAPWRYDVLRLVTSVLLGAREIGATGTRALDLADALLDAYVAHAHGRATLPPAPRPVEELIGRVMVRTRRELLDARTEVVRGERRFVRGARYHAIPRALAKDAAVAFARYVARLDEDERAEEAAYEVIDAAFRVAGTGSLGCLRIAILCRGKGGADGAWIFDMKEEGTPSGAALIGAPRMKPAKRVMTAMRACLAQPPRMLGATRLGDKSMLVRRLAPQEDKLELAQVRDADLEPLARYLGALTGAAHRRGAARAPAKRWTEEDRAGIVERAVVLAGLHEAVYLAMCKMAR